MWEVWQWNGQYIKGDLLKKFKSKSAAIKHADKVIKHDRVVKGDQKDEFYLEDNGGIPMGMIVREKQKS